MKRRFISMLIIMAFLLSFTACSPKEEHEQPNTNDTDTTENNTEISPASVELPEPNTNLEFWIRDNVDGFDFSEYQKKYGIFGGREYYGKGYTPTLDEYGAQIDPEHCVLYTITSYPDYSDREKHITHILITDPEIEIYGLTVNSTPEEFEARLSELGFNKVGSGAKSIKMEMGNVWISLMDKQIRINANVENREGIVF